jgi:hypothetical protein
VKTAFFDLESFSGRGDFLAKAHTYQLYFNLVRPNTHKQNLSPLADRRATSTPLASPALLAPARLLGLLLERLWGLRSP